MEYEHEMKEKKEMKKHEMSDKEHFEHLHERMMMIEKHLGLDKKKKSKEEGMRERNRH